MTTVEAPTHEDFAARIKIRAPDLATRNAPVKRLHFHVHTLHGNPTLGIQELSGPTRWGPIIDEDGRPFLVFLRQPRRAVTSDLGAKILLDALEMRMPEIMPPDPEVSLGIQGVRAFINFPAAASQALYERVGQPHEGGSGIARTLRPCQALGAVRRIDDSRGKCLLFCVWIKLH